MARSDRLEDEEWVMPLPAALLLGACEEWPTATLNTRVIQLPFATSAWSVPVPLEHSLAQSGEPPDIRDDVEHIKLEERFYVSDDGLVYFVGLGYGPRTDTLCWCYLRSVSHGKFLEQLKAIKERLHKERNGEN